jgi:predicted transcriptional regulator
VTTVRTQTMRTPAETLRQGTASKATHTSADQYGGADQRWQRTTLGLGPLQSAIMEVLWAAGTPLMVKEIRERVNYPPVSHSTVAVMTSILCGSGLVHRELTGRRGVPGPAVWKYHATRPANEYIGELIATLLDYSPSPGKTLAHALSSARCAHKIDSIHPGGQEHGHDV